ncbi:MAG: hypothetical protein AAF138_02480 [Planctomycetota bacterium]
MKFVAIGAVAAAGAVALAQPATVADLGTITSDTDAIFTIAPNEVA